MTAKPAARTTPPAFVGETPFAPQQPSLVLFGRDGAGRPRAAWFADADAEAASAAAGIMRLRALPLTDEPGRDLAGQLARGRVLPSGRAHVPFAKRDLVARIIALAGDEIGLSVAVGGETGTAGNTGRAGLGIFTGPVPASTPADPPEKPTAPRPGDRAFVGCPHPGSREEIGLGSVVLAHEGPEDGWFEAEVIGVNGPVFALRWQGWPTDPTILRKAGELALLPPGEA
ncbi:hypothetical protein [Sphingomonas sp.]|uniref:hypothetical protein n=1 Tax=Sphingomonas sp. TaxID=28214 RepID=UPI003B0059B7